MSRSPNEAVIVDGCRTPIGRAHKGSLIDVDAISLARTVMITAALRSALA